MLLFGFGGVRNVSLGAFIRLANLGERVSLEGDCSRPTVLRVLENGGLSVPPSPLKVKRGDLGAECHRALGKSSRGRPDISWIAPHNFGALQEVGQHAFQEGK